MLRTELLEMKEKFGTPRRTEIVGPRVRVRTSRTLIQREDMVVTVTHGGYIKRVPLSTYRAQRRGGSGRAGMATRDEDFVSQVVRRRTPITPVLFFSTRGMVYKLKVYRLPLGNAAGARQGRWSTCCRWSEGETISTVMPLPEDEASWATSHDRCSRRRAATSGATSSATSSTSRRTARSRMKLERAATA